MNKIILGLDLGITSIGWALVNVDDNDLTKNKIIDSGVRIFTIAEHPKKGESLALPRRKARSARRTIKRKAQKLRAIKRLLIAKKILTQNELDNLFIGNKGQKDVWELRREALYRGLNNKELSRIMIHLAKHRGYFSNRKSEDIIANEDLIKNTANKDSKKEKKGINFGIKNNIKNLESSSYLTIGEYISHKDEKKKEKKRNSKDNYQNTVARSMLVEEIEIIFEKQKEFESNLVNDDLLQTYKELAFEQRPLKSVAGMIANCPFEIDEKRASKSSYSFEYFRALQKLKNLRVIDETGYEMPLIFEQITQIIHKAKTTTKFTYKSFKKLFPQYKEMKIKGLTYHDYKTGEVKDPEGVKFLDFSAYQKIHKAILNTDNLYWDKIENNYEILDAIAKVLTTEKDDKESLKQLSEIVESEKVAQALLNLSFSGFGHLSNKALRSIIPYLEAGEDYDKACDKAGYDFKAIFKGEKTLLLPPLSKQENIEMTNPVVKRAVAQMRLVYNAIARKYGAIDTIHIEFTRDIKKSHKDRKKIKKAQGEFRDKKEEARIHASEILGHEPNAKELLKFRLWKEQNGECVYSGKEIHPDVLNDPYATEVDHILPYSRSLDDSLNNKVLCFTKENQEKGSKTPYEYMSQEKFDVFEQRVKGYKNIRQAKQGRLLKTNFDKNSKLSFKDRNKNDTSYISVFIKNYMEAHIAFNEPKNKDHIFTMNGMLTAQLRYKWGVGDKNRENHLHHAEDAIILAFSTKSMVKELSDVSSKCEGYIYQSKEKKSKALRFVTPLEDFGVKVKESLNNIFVSYMPRRKIGGAAHKATIYSQHEKSKGVVEINKGLVENGEVKRIDVFEKAKKYHFVYLYTLDFVKEEIKNITIKGKVIDDTYEFQFSIFKNDLIELELEEKKAFGYLKFAEGDGRFHIIPQSHAVLNKKDDRYSTGLTKVIKKYQVDVLGNYTEVKNESRQMTIKYDWDKKIKKRAIRRAEKKKNKS